MKLMLTTRSTCTDIVAIANELLMNLIARRNPYFITARVLFEQEMSIHNTILSCIDNIILRELLRDFWDLM